MCTSASSCEKVPICPGWTYSGIGMRAEANWNTFFFKKILNYSWFTMFCQFLLYSKVCVYTHTHTHTHTLFLTLPSIIFRQRWLYIVPVLCSKTSLLTLSKCNSLYLPTPNSQSIPLPPSSPGCCKSSLHVCESVSILYIGSSVPYFRFHIQVIACGICLSFSDFA